MGALTNTCEGVSGASVPTTNAGAPSAFNTTAAAGAGTTETWDSTHIHSGTTALLDHIAAGVSSSIQQTWSVLPSTPTANAYVRCYLYLTAYPVFSVGTTAGVCRFIGVAALRAAVVLQPTGELRTINSAGTTISTTTEQVPLNQLVRIEFELTGISGTTGTVAARIFSGANLEGNTPDAGGSVSASNGSIGGTVDTVRWGPQSAITLTSAWDSWWDDLGYSDTASPGPFAPLQAWSPPTQGWRGPSRMPPPFMASNAGFSPPAAGTISGGATLAGAGSIDAALATIGAGAALAAAGSVSAPAVQAAPAALAAAGSIDAALAAQAAPAALAAAGSISGSGSSGDVATLGGTGSVSAPAVQGAIAALAAAGSIGSALAVQSAGAVLAAAGSVTAAGASAAPSSPSWTATRAAWRGPPKVPAPLIASKSGNDFSTLTLAVVADMQPGAAVNPPPSVVAGVVMAANPTHILMPGDLANDGTAAQYGFFNTMYGKAKTRIAPIPGNHDWVPTNLTDYNAYFGGNPLTIAGSGPPSYYSFDLPNGWHVIMLDSDDPPSGIDHTAGSPQMLFLAADLAAHASQPVIACWHHPRWSDGNTGSTGDTAGVQTFWSACTSAQVDLVFSGHCHSYQRFPKWDSSGNPASLGTREIVVGTGGSGLHTGTPTRNDPGSGDSLQTGAYDQLNSPWFGYLQLTLTPAAYSGKFVSQDGVTVMDSFGPFPTNLALNASGSGLAAVQGAGSLTASAVQGAGAALAGAGSLAAAAVQLAPATLAAAGSITTPAVQQAPAALAAVGSVTSPAVQGAGSVLTGAGAITAFAGGVQPGAAALAGAGALTAPASQQQGGGLGGSGSLAAPPSLQLAPAVLAAAGSLNALALQRAGAALAGAGLLAGIGAAAASVVKGYSTATTVGETTRMAAAVSAPAQSLSGVT